QITVNATVYDEAGNSHAAAPVTVSKDITADVDDDFEIVPAFADRIYGNDEYENHSFSLRGVDTADLDTVIVVLSMEGKEDYELELSSSDLSIPSNIFVTAGMTEGKVSITAKVTDHAGNTKFAQEVNVTIDRTADKDDDFEITPSLIGRPYGSEFLSNGNLFSFNGVDEDAEKIVLTLEQAGKETITTTISGPQPFTVPNDVLSAFGNGEVSIGATVYDKAGNTSDADAITIEIDLSAEVIATHSEFFLILKTKNTTQKNMSKTALALRVSMRTSYRPLLFSHKMECHLPPSLSQSHLPSIKISLSKQG
ncbi:hypothetical protein CS022_14670, partial [Veronia nyctiphanis]